MSHLVLINAKSGTVRDRGAATLKQDVEAAFREGGAEAEVRMIRPGKLDDTIRKTLAENSRPETVIVGGGDGSLSAAAPLLAGTDTALGVLPLGTMNLLARALGVPLDPAEAVKALLGARPEKIDLLEINGQSVLLHASIGLQPKVIRVREALPYKTRFMRLTNGVIAWLRATRRLPQVRVTGKCGKRLFERTTSAMLISNNVLPEGIGATPVAHDLTRGEIGVYVSTSKRRSDLVKLALATSLGFWRQSDLVEEYTTHKLDIETNKKTLLLAIDGELVRLHTPLACRVRPRCLRVLMPPGAAGET